MIKKLLSVLLIFISLNAFANKILELPYIITQKKLGNHGYCFVSRTQKEVSSMEKLPKKIIVCYTDLKLNIIKKTEVELDAHVAFDGLIDIQFTDSIFSVLFTNSSFTGNLTNAYFFNIFNGNKVYENKKKSSILKYYPSESTESNTEIGFTEVTFKDEEEKIISISFFNSNFKKIWNAEIETYNVKKPFNRPSGYFTGICYGNKFYFSYYAKKIKGFRAIESNYTISILDLKDGKIISSVIHETPFIELDFNFGYNLFSAFSENKPFNSYSLMPKSFISSDSVFIKFGVTSFTKDDVISKTGIVHFSLDKPEEVKTKEIGNLSHENLIKSFPNANVKLSNNLGNSRFLKSYYSFDNLIYSASVFDVESADANSLFIVRKINTSDWKNESTKKFFTTSSPLKRKGWYNFFGINSNQISHGDFFNTKCNYSDFNLMWQTDNNDIYFVIPDWKNTTTLPKVKTYNLTNKASKIIEWIPSFDLKESKIVEANIVEGVDDSVLLYEIDESGKAHFHFESMKE
jgi:hypothetical protein